MPERFFGDLSTTKYTTLVALCRESGEPGPSYHAIQQAMGASADKTAKSLYYLRKNGWSSKQIITLIQQLSMVANKSDTSEHQFDLVLSGPDVEGIPIRETVAIMHTLFSDAIDEILLVGYAVYNGAEIFQRLAERMQEQPKMKVWMCLDIQRPHNDTSLESEIVRRFVSNFFHHQWIWPVRPELYYDPRSLIVDSKKRSSLHAKCVVVDRRSALITSANFTLAAQQRNIEAGVVIHDDPAVYRIYDYFNALRQNGILKQAPITTDG